MSYTEYIFVSKFVRKSVHNYDNSQLITTAVYIVDCHFAKHIKPYYNPSSNNTCIYSALALGLKD